MSFFDIFKSTELTPEQDATKLRALKALTKKFYKDVQPGTGAQLLITRDKQDPDLLTEWTVSSTPVKGYTEDNERQIIAEGWKTLEKIKENALLIAIKRLEDGAVKAKFYTGDQVNDKATVNGRHIDSLFFKTRPLSYSKQIAVAKKGWIPEDASAYTALLGRPDLENLPRYTDKETLSIPKAASKTMLKAFPGVSNSMDAALAHNLAVLNNPFNPEQDRKLAADAIEFLRAYKEDLKNYPEFDPYTKVYVGQRYASPANRKELNNVYKRLLGKNWTPSAPKWLEWLLPEQEDRIRRDIVKAIKSKIANIKGLKPGEIATLLGDDYVLKEDGSVVRGSYTDIPTVQQGTGAVVARPVTAEDYRILASKAAKDVIAAKRAKEASSWAYPGTDIYRKAK